MSSVTGFTYKAENYTPEACIALLIQEGVASPAAQDMDPDDAVRQVVESNGFDYDDQYSYDSDEFPKPITSDMDAGELLDVDGTYVTASLRRQADGGRGSGGMTKGEVITSLDQVENGDLLIQVSDQFGATNLIEVTNTNPPGPPGRGFNYIYATDRLRPEMFAWIPDSSGDHYYRAEGNRPADAMPASFASRRTAGKCPNCDHLDESHAMNDGHCMMANCDCKSGEAPPPSKREGTRRTAQQYDTGDLFIAYDVDTGHVTPFPPALADLTKGKYLVVDFNNAVKGIIGATVRGISAGGQNGALVITNPDDGHSTAVDFADIAIVQQREDEGYYTASKRTAAEATKCPYCGSTDTETREGNDLACKSCGRVWNLDPNAEWPINTASLDRMASHLISEAESAPSRVKVATAQRFFGRHDDNFLRGIEAALNDRPLRTQASKAYAEGYRAAEAFLSDAAKPGWADAAERLGRAFT